MSNWVLYLVLGLLLGITMFWRQRQRPRPPAILDMCYAEVEALAATRRAARAEAQATLKKARTSLSTRLIRENATDDALMHFDAEWERIIKVARRIYGEDAVDEAMRELGL